MSFRCFSNSSSTALDILSPAEARSAARRWRRASSAPSTITGVAVIGIGFGASVALDGYQRTADSAYVGSGARPDPEPKLRGVDPQKKS